MPRYTINVHTLTHVCAAESEPHVVDTWRSIVDVDYWGPCLNPRTIRCGDRVVQVDCGSIAPARDQCGTCRVTILVHNETTVDLGPEATCACPAHSGVLPQLCPVCGVPVAAIFADTGQHPGCEPRRGAR